MTDVAEAQALGIGVRDFGPADGAVGRSVYLQGQLHANESAAMLVLHELVRQLGERPAGNRVRVVPNANPIGWERYLNASEGRFSRNGTNWNRMFIDPPAQSGTTDDRLARALWRLSSPYDVVIDVHTPDFGWGHLYASHPDKRLVTMDDIPHVIYGAPTRGPFDECHFRLEAQRAVPVTASVTLEVPSHALPTPEFVRGWAARLYREIEAQAEGKDPAGAPDFAGTMVDLVPKISGAVVVRCAPGERLRAGAEILTVHGRDGEEESLTAPGDCVPVSFRRPTVVQAGYWACRVICAN